METRRKKQTQKNLFTMISGGFVIEVKYNSFIDSKQHFFKAYLVTILKVLYSTKSLGRLLVFATNIIVKSFSPYP